MTDRFLERLQASLGEACTIDRELGGGGMSRVFVATESALARQIVVKVLPSATGSTVSAERFKREIRVAARLQHPHIVPLLTAGEADGLPYYTMPFVKGESLRHRLAKGGELSINETVHVLRDIAAALAYAHGEGVVHRDIKPENVMLSGGVAVVTDFGVAKAVDVALSDGGSTQTGLTSLGIALGTPAYMAPEQATADPHVDHRADIYSFGCVAYEMLAGTSPFAGRAPQQLLAAHVTESAEPLDKRRPSVPPALVALVMQCLEKRSGDRPQSATDLIAALDAIATPSGGTMPTMAQVAASSPLRQRWFVPAVVIVAGMAVAATWWWRGRVAPRLEVGATTSVAATPDLEMEPAISPDGRLVAYVASTPAGARIFVRQISGGRANLLTSEPDAPQAWPRWSPDGATISFTARGGIYVVPALGGTPRRTIDEGDTHAWSPDGQQIVYSDLATLHVQDLSGGPPRLLARGQGALHSPAWSPSGRFIAYVEGNRPTLVNLSASSVWVIPAAGGNAVRVSDSTHLNVSPAWTADGRSLLFVSDAQGTREVYQQAISTGGRAIGGPDRLTTGLGPYVITLSADGTRLAHDDVRNHSNIWMAPLRPAAPVDLASAVQLTRDNQRIEVMSVSHDGQWLAFDADRAGNFDIYKLRLDGGEPVQLTTDPGADFAPTWSPDDRQLVFHSQRTGTRHIYTVSAEGSGDNLIASGPGQDFFPAWSPDGQRVAFFSMMGGGTGILLVATREADGSWGPPQRLNDDPVAGNSGAKWSPDGQSVAYMVRRDSSVLRGVNELTIASLADGRSRVVATEDQLGGNPVALAWGSDPGTLYVSIGPDVGARLIKAVPVAGGEPRLIFAEDTDHVLGRLDFATDGRRIFFTLAKQDSDVGVIELKK